VAKIIQFKTIQAEQDKLYGECPTCGCDEFHLLMTIDEEVMGAECWRCRLEYIFEGDGIVVELE
jgi:hypothetical protein